MARDEMNDPFEEFEFKPLTEGLGFHRKDKAPQTREGSSALIGEKVFKTRGLDLLEEESTTLRPPLQRKSLKIEEDRLTPSSNAVDEVLKALSQNPKPRTNTSPATKTSTTLNTSTTGDLSPWTPDVVSFAAVLLDGLLILASGLLCMIVLLAVTKVDLIGNLSQPDEQGTVFLSTLAVFAGVSFIYSLVNRVFLGYTPGEWAYDQRIGTIQQSTHWSYPLKVSLRWILVAITGGIVIPLLSIAFNKDLAGQWTGTPLLRKK